MEATLSDNSPIPSNPITTISENPATPQTQTVPPAPPTTAVQAPLANNMIYAGIGKRLLAALIDAAIIGFIGGLIGFSATFATAIFINDSPSSFGTLLPLFINLPLVLIYFTYFIGKHGQALGKKALKIKVVKIDSQEAPGYSGAFLREFIGKFFSSIFLLGYLWAFWDGKKQTWHDKIAHTIVISV